MKFSHIIVAMVIIPLGAVVWSNGLDFEVPISRAVVFDFENQPRGDCTSCSTNYDPVEMGAECCDQVSDWFSCTELESIYYWDCSGCECAGDEDFVSMYGCTDALATNYSSYAEYDDGSCWYSDLTAVGDTSKIILSWTPFSASAENNRNRECTSEVCLSIDNVDIENGTLDIYMINTIGVGGFQFELFGISVTGASGGAAEDAGFVISSSTTTVLGFSLTGATITPGESVLTQVSFTGFEGSTICFGEDSSCEGAAPNVISDAAGGCINADWGDCYGSSVSGCTEMDACNYNAEATEDDGSCEYAEINYDCDGDCIVEIDCTGECGGSAVEDECGVCDSDNSNDCVQDCAGVWGGSADYDVCGICGGNETDVSNCSGVPCDGEFDDCGICTGGSTGLEFNYAMDCNGICLGPLLFSCIGAVGNTLVECEENGGYWSIDGIDQCDVCGGNGYVDWECNDGGGSCWDIADGACDCDGNILDCDGICGGTAELDDCGVCNGGGMVECFMEEMVCHLGDCPIYYNIYRSEDGVDTNDLISGPILDSSYTDIGFEYLNTFCYTVTYIDGHGIESAYSNSACAEPIVLPGLFTYNPSTLPMVYTFSDITLISLDSTNIITSDDWVGAFNGDVCVGALHMTENDGLGDCDQGLCMTMFIYGDDGSGDSNGYMDIGDLPTFKIWDATSNDYYDASSSNECIWENQGYCWSDLLTSNIFGCTDDSACNFDSDATEDDGTCIYNDCNGDCGGSAYTDNCAGCVGGNTDSTDCVPDCSESEEECDTDYWLEGQCWGGSAEIDNCTNCVGGNTGLTACMSDCSESEEECNTDYWLEGQCWGGLALEDECGDCDEDPDNDCVQDCSGEWGGSSVLDMCLVCDEDPDNDCVQDCSGEWGGDLTIDECGDCGGDGPGEGYICEDIPDGFSWNQTSIQAFYFVDEIYDECGDLLVPGEDWVGAFNGDVCVGAKRWTGETMDIPGMGNDTLVYSEGYLIEGDIPTFKIYDASEDRYIDAFPYPYNSEDLEFSNFLIAEIEMFLTEFSNFNLPLEGSTNLVSFYALPQNTEINVVLESLSGAVKAVLTEGSAAIYQGNGMWSGSLTHIEFDKGYWIITDNSFDADTISFIGFNCDINPEYCLHQGANLISFPDDGSYEISSAIPDDVEDNFVAIISENHSALNLDIGWIGSLMHFQGGSGYWIIVNEALCYSFNLEESMIRVVTPFTEILPENNEFSVMQSHQQAFYFIDEIILRKGEIDPGDWLLAYNGDIIAGIRQWQGEMIDIPAMGVSEDNVTTGYFNKGDIPIFKLLKQSTGKMTTLSGDIPTWTSNGVYVLNGLVEMEPLPEQFIINKVYPNPFNPVTSIYFGIPVDSKVSVQVYNLHGRIIEVLANQYMEAGYHSLMWNADNNSSGVYLLKIVAGEYVATQKLMLVK